MAKKKCDVGFKDIKGKCKRNAFYFGITDGDKSNIRHIINRVILTVSAWGVFWAIINLTGLRDSNHWTLLILSLIIGLITFRFGVK